MNDSRTTKKVTVFGSSKISSDSSEYAEAVKLGMTLGHLGWTIVSGGYGGVMAAVSHGADSAGAHTIGVVSRSFPDRKPNQWVKEHVTVDTYQERLFTLIEMGDAYIAMPGSTGTLAEVAMVCELQRHGIETKKPLVLYSQFWVPLRAMMVAQDAAGRIGTLAETPENAAELLRAIWVKKYETQE
jgi:uncharacterized protein (TIGR00730 family)